MGQQDMVTEPKTPQIASQTPKNPKRRKISEHDLEMMAELYRDGLNDTEACQQLGIQRDSWYNFKSKAKNETRFNDILARMRGNRIKWCFGKIEAAASKDFRAARELLALTAPERFNDRHQQAINNTQINVYQQLGLDIERLLADGNQRKQQPVIEATEVKQLPEPPKTGNP